LTEQKICQVLIVGGEPGQSRILIQKVSLFRKVLTANHTIAGGWNQPPCALASIAPPLRCGRQGFQIVPDVLYIFAWPGCGRIIH
jgi:hypothetical protein